jgi:hypothetical protein
MPLNSFITLGRSGLRVSPFCLGSMTFGEDLGWGASVADSEAMIANTCCRRAGRGARRLLERATFGSSSHGRCFDNQASSAPTFE